ncbi:MAG: sugar phosphate nucleotidyltransferase [Ectobacillus sp.]
MKLILLSGGSGKRLWPLSNDSRSKQFLKMLPNENGAKESMIQRIWRQLQTSGLAASSYITTGKSQVDIIQSQLGNELPLLIEPERRDTFPAIALAAAYLHSVRDASLDEVVCVLPVDAYVEDSFFQAIKQFEAVLADSNASLALMGVRPSYPSAQYGYIVPVEKQRASSYVTVRRFVEKPNEETAAALMKQNALWNCGVFAFKLGYLLQLLHDKGIPAQYEALLQQYSRLPRRSFDYEVVEQTEHIAAIPYDGIWHDLGTWNTLTGKFNTNIIGKGTMSDDAINTHLINELELPVIIAGISNGIVVASHDGILVADKSASSQIKELTGHLGQRPMYEEKRWGCYSVLDYSKLEDGNEVLTKRLKILAGKNLSYQMHLKREEVWTIISGEGEFIIDGKFKHVKPGDVIHIPVGAKHGARAISDLECIEVQMGSELVEEDIVRIHMKWEDIEHDFKDRGEREM